ncbi:MAG: DUF1206 domain-containing protein [Allosphingosinicella sp.]
MTNVGRMEAITRAGFAARGILYVLIGYFALRTGRAEDGAEALQHLNDGAGKLLLGAMALGFAGYGVWRLAEAIVDTEGHGRDAKGVAVRAGGAVSGLVHLLLALLAAKLVLGWNEAGSGSSAEQGAATALALPGGAMLAAAVAAALAATGLFQLAKAYKAGFLRHLDGAAVRQLWLVWMGRAGYAARGIVFLIMGWLFWRAAREADAGEAGDMSAALASLPAALQTAVAAGLLLFGLFSLVEARYRRINDPQVAARMKAATRAAIGS